MLVLSRKIGEKIVIGDGIVVTVLETKGKGVRLGIEAAPNVPVWRGELTSGQNHAGRQSGDHLVGVN